MINTFLLSLGAILIVAGFLVVAAAMLQIRKAPRSRSAVRGGGIIMIGPIPIIFGTDEKSVRIIIILALILVSSLAIFYLIQFLSR